MNRSIFDGIAFLCKVGISESANSQRCEHVCVFIHSILSQTEGSYTLMCMCVYIYIYIYIYIKRDVNPTWHRSVCVCCVQNKLGGISALEADKFFL